MVLGLVIILGMVVAILIFNYSQHCKEKGGEHLLKILNIIFVIFLILSTIFLILIATVIKASHETEIYLIFILIALSLKLWMFCKNK